MKSIIAALFLFTAHTAFAASHFEDLKALYEKAARPSINELLDIWAGRCFGEKSDRPIPAVFGIFEVTENAGPEFPNQTSLVLANLTDASQYADYWDNAKKADIMNRVGLNFFSWEFSQFSLIIHEYYGDIMVRKAGQYLLLNDIRNQRYCYYFKKLN